MKLYTIDNALLTECPEIRIGDKVYPLDDRQKTAEKVMKLYPGRRRRQQKRKHEDDPGSLRPGFWKRTCSGNRGHEFKVSGLSSPF